MSPYLHVDGIWKTYDGEQVVLNPVTFRLDSSKRVILINGENGTGKTTLINILIGLEKQSGGSFRLSSISDVSVLFQKEGLLPQLTVAKNLKIVGASEEAAKNTLSRYGLLSSRYHSFPKNLSGGEERRVQLARLSLSSRAIWILDEPTSHADLPFRRILQAELSSHVNKNGFCILITHDPELLAYIRQEMHHTLIVVATERSLEKTT